MSEAERFYKVLPKQLSKYGLVLHEDKSQILKAGSIAAKRAVEIGEKIRTFNFLGITCYWGKCLASSKISSWRQLFLPLFLYKKCSMFS